MSGYPWSAIAILVFPVSDRKLHTFCNFCEGLRKRKFCCKSIHSHKVSTHFFSEIYQVSQGTSPRRDLLISLAAKYAERFESAIQVRNMTRVSGDDRV